MATLQLEDYLPTLEETSVAADGRPLVLRLDQIDEDPAQPRHEFDAEGLSELAASIKLRGVLQPVSVRQHPERAGRYRLNFGARRLRASSLAGKLEIPAFIDALASSYDQVIENEHREALQPMELALFVKRQLDAGETQAKVAAGLAKSRAYVCYVSALIDPPDWLMAIYREGRCRGVKELYDLRRMHEEHPDDVSRFVAGKANVSRGEVEALREQLAARTTARSQAPAETQGKQAARTRSGAVSPSEKSSMPARTKPLPRERWALLAEAGPVTVEIVLGALPAAVDEVFVVEAGAESRESIRIDALKGLRLQRTNGAINKSDH